MIINTNKIEETERKHAYNGAGALMQSSSDRRTVEK